MSKNIYQIYTANPITSNASTDLMYFGQSPYSSGTNDAAMTFANFSAQFGAPYTAAALTSSNDTNVTLTLGGTPATALLHAASITAGWAGQLAVGRGGTGNSTFTAYSLICAGTTATGAFQNVSGLGTSNQVLVSNGASALPSWQSVPGLTPAALTEVNDTNVTLTLGGTPSTALLQATSITAGWSGQLSLARGGTNANLTASDGGIFYSTASAGAILAGTATANQVLLSGSSTTPAWSTATYPATTTVNQLLYSSSSNVIGGIAASANGVLISSNSNVPSWLANGTAGYALVANSGAPPSWQAVGGAYTASALTESNDTNVTLTLGGTPSTALLQAVSITAGWTGQLAVGRGGTGAASFNTNGVVISNTSGTGALAALSLTDGQVVIGSSAGAPAAATLSAGTGVSIANGHNTITISSNGANPWVDQTTSSVTMAVNTGYTSDDGASLVTFTLPTASAIGDWVEINGKGSGLWTIAQASGQQIKISPSATTLGATGSLSSVNQYDCVRLRCITANTIWVVVSQQSTGLTVV